MMHLEAPLPAQLASTEHKPQRANAKSECGELNSLHNGLDTLRALNRRLAITARQLAGELGLSRTSARRILDTLVTAGMVDKVAYDPHYRLAPAAAELSSGLSVEDVLSHVATPLLFNASDRIGWTLSLVTVADGQMVLQVCTQKVAAYAITSFGFGECIPICASHAGRLAMAYMTPGERQSLREQAQAAGIEQSDSSYSEIEAAALRKAGYYLPPRAQLRESHLYVPLVMGDGVPGCLIMRYLVSALSVKQLMETYLPLMQSLSSQISERATHIMSSGKISWPVTRAHYGLGSVPL